MQPPIPPPQTSQLLGPLLASLPAASISPSPPDALLPLLSPILRQRVQLLSAADQEPWLPLLCYNTALVPKLESAVKHERFEPHPVSGEVEIDWEYDVEVRYKRQDEETLQALASLRDFDLSVKLVWCTNDEPGGGDGWRIGEVSTITPDIDAGWGFTSIGLAEEAFEKGNRQTGYGLLTPDADFMDEDDDDYWAQYDNTPARTPGPVDTAPATSATSNGNRNAEADYYAQYSAVQPALSNDDPDEARENGAVESSLGREEVIQHIQHNLSHSPSSADFCARVGQLDGIHDSSSGLPDSNIEREIVHPRPASSTGSSGSDTVAKLERGAAATAAQEQSEIGIKQHIGTSVKSLYRLARSAGIERDEFERLVRTELDCLSFMDEEL